MSSTTTTQNGAVDSSEMQRPAASDADEFCAAIKWSREEVAQFLIQNDCPFFGEVCKEQELNGEQVLSVTAKQLRAMIAGTTGESHEKELERMVGLVNYLRVQHLTNVLHGSPSPASPISD